MEVGEIYMSNINLFPKNINSHNHEKENLHIQGLHAVLSFMHLNAAANLD